MLRASPVTHGNRSVLAPAKSRSNMAWADQLDQQALDPARMVGHCARLGLVFADNYDLAIVVARVHHPGRPDDDGVCLHATEVEVRVWAIASCILT